MKVYILQGGSVDDGHCLVSCSAKPVVIAVSVHRLWLEDKVKELSKKHSGYWSGTITEHEVEGTEDES